MKNLIISGVLLLVVAYFGAKWHLHGKVRDSVDSAVAMARPFADISYEGISSTLGGELTVDGVRARIGGFRDELYIERIGIDTPSFLSLLGLADLAKKAGSPGDVLPEHFGFLAEGVHMPVGADYFRTLYEKQLEAFGGKDSDDAAAECVGKYGFSPATLAALGYEEQVFSMWTTFRQDNSRYRLEIRSTALDMWDFDIEMTLVGDMVSELAKGAAYRPRMSALRIEYTDRSLKQRVSDYCGRRGLTDDEIVAAQLDAFRHIGATNGIEFDEYVLGPYLEFLDGKSSLVFTASPAEPVTLSQIGLYKPSDVPALLDLSASAM